MPKSRLKDRARNLRASQTRAEVILWHAIRDRRLGGWKWRRQAPRGSFIVDFYCAERDLVVELDGGVHLGQPVYDFHRTEWLENQGLTVLRFENKAVVEDIDGVCAAILTACGGQAPHPASPREGRGEEKN